MAERGQLRSETRVHEDVTRIRAEVDKLHLHHLVLQSRPITADPSAPTIHLFNQCQFGTSILTTKPFFPDEVYQISINIQRSYGDPVLLRRILRGRLLPTRMFRDI